MFPDIHLTINYIQRRHCKLQRQLAKKVETLWKESFPDAALFPVIGLPSNANGVLTLTHTDGSGMLMRINGLP